MNTSQPSIDVVGASATDSQWLINQVTRMLPLLAPVPGGNASFSRISIRVVHDGEMARMHEEHSHVAGTTDVLTFVSHDDRGSLEVDLALCTDEAQRCSEEFGHGINEELALYAVHGLLHAVGLTDHDEPSARLMHDHEDRILSAIGVVALSANRKESS